MSAQDITLIIGGVPTIAAAVIAIIAAWRSNSKSNATDAKLTAHLQANPDTFQDRTGTK